MTTRPLPATTLAQPCVPCARCGSESDWLADHDAAIRKEAREAALDEVGKLHQPGGNCRCNYSESVIGCETWRTIQALIEQADDA